MSVSMGHLTALRARTLAWPQGLNLAEQDPRNLCSENRAHPAVVRQAARRWRRATLAATREEHPFSGGRRRRILSAYRGKWYQARIPQRSGGSAQHPRGHLRTGGDGFPLRRRSDPGRGLVRRLRRLPRRPETSEARHARALQPSVRHVEWRRCVKCGGRWHGLRAPGKVRVWAGTKERSPEGGVGFHG